MAVEIIDGKLFEQEFCADLEHKKLKLQIN